MTDHATEQTYIEQITAMLEQGPMTREQIAMKLGLTYSATTKQMRVMHRELRTIRKTHSKLGVLVTWELGEDPNLQTEETNERGDSQKTVPARQMDMPRDPLVAALFGPARVTA